MDFLKRALNGVTGDLKIGQFGAIHFGGDQGVSATASGRVTTGGNAPFTGPETQLLLYGAIALVVVFFLARRLS